ncbi:MAG TPA: hypothetical protein VFT22_05690 [Kofleriaceae bacterium]|nr:hypothetical protein [Kofleriaceae bacterium]
MTSYESKLRAERMILVEVTRVSASMRAQQAAIAGPDSQERV